MYLTHALRAIVRAVVATGDALWKYVGLLLSGTPSPATFISDASKDNQVITVNGDARPNGFNPYTPGYYSNYFDGSGDYLSVDLGTSGAIGTTGTVEFWYYPTVSPSIARLINNGTASGAVLDVYDLSSKIGFSNILETTSTVRLNTWTHIACVVNSGTATIYFNGIAQPLSGTTTGINITATATTWVGGISGYAQWATGYISNLRVVKGTAVYTAAFTPPTAPLTAITNTSLLTCQSNRFIDNGPNAFAITRNGNTSVGSFQPFTPDPAYASYGSTYFDGTGDYLSNSTSPALSFGTSAYTVEFWMYYQGATGGEYDIVEANPASGAFQLYVASSSQGLKWGLYGVNSFAILSASSIPLNTWTHISVSRVSTSSNQTFAFVNGALVNTTTDNNNYTGVGFGIGGRNNGSNYYTGFLSNVRIVKGTALYTTNFVPPAIPLTATAETTLLTCQTSQPINNKTFLDESSNNLLMTSVGNGTQGSFSPYGANWSNYFDGNGDYFTLPSNQSQFSMGTGDFTIEMWVYIISLAGERTLYDTSNAGDPNAIGRILIRVTADSGIVQFATGAGNNLTSGGAVAINTWCHIAITKANNSTRIFINGTQVNTTYTDNNTYTVGTSNRPIIGINSYDNSSAPMLGYISNLRVVKGVAVYTTTFTPPTSPLQATQSSGTNIAAITGTSTSLLTLQSPTFIDNSTNNFTITSTGNTTPSIQNPFGYTSATTEGYSVSTIGGSNYSDNTGTIYSNIASPIAGSTTDWTMEAWVYFNSFGSSSWIFGLGNNTGGTTPYVELRAIDSSTVRFAEATTVSAAWAIQVAYTFTAGQWYHFAGTRSGSTIRLFINGIQIGSTTYASAIQSGLKPFTNGLLFASGGARSDGVNGYVSDTRMIAGTALYTSNFVPPASPLTAIQNTSWLVTGTGAGIYDAAMMNDMQTIGDAKLSTAVTKFGGSSMYFDGTDDHIQATNIQPLGSGDFTFEMWIYPLDTNSRHVFSFGAGWSPANGISMIQYGGNFALSCGTGWAPANAGQAIEINGWHHIALVRNSTAVKFYYDGVMKGSGTDSTNLTATGIDIGYAFSGAAWGSFYGYIDDLRITKGYARYTSNFTPPTAPFKTY